jgi:hypothetical protein
MVTGADAAGFRGVAPLADVAMKVDVGAVTPRAERGVAELRGVVPRTRGDGDELTHRLVRNWESAACCAADGDNPVNEERNAELPPRAERWPGADEFTSDAHIIGPGRNGDRDSGRREPDPPLAERGVDDARADRGAAALLITARGVAEVPEARGVAALRGVAAAAPTTAALAVSMTLALLSL